MFGCWKVQEVQRAIKLECLQQGTGELLFHPFEWDAKPQRVVVSPARAHSQIRAERHRRQYKTGSNAHRAKSARSGLVYIYPIRVHNTCVYLLHKAIGSCRIMFCVFAAQERGEEVGWIVCHRDAAQSFFDIFIRFHKWVGATPPPLGGFERAGFTFERLWNMKWNNNFYQRQTMAIVQQQ